MQTAYQQAIERALQEIGKLEQIAKKKKATRSLKQEDWNIVASRLRDELLQGQGSLPPEEFRRAIEQYFDVISRVEKSVEVESQN